MIGGTGREHVAGAGRLASLLWPPSSPPGRQPTAELPGDVVADLDLEPLVNALSGHEPAREAFVRKLLTTLCTDPAIIIYRQEVIANLLAEPDLRERLGGLRRMLAPLLRERFRPLFQSEWTLPDVVARLGDLELYVDAALAVAAALDTPVRAPALRALKSSGTDLIATPEFETLRAELPGLRSQLDGLQSVTIGVNLSPGLQPESATILSLDNQRIEGRGGLLRRLLGGEAGRQGITPLRGEQAGGLASFFPPMRGNARGRENELVHDLQRLLEQVVAPVGQVLDRYVSIHTDTFATLESELAFLLNAAALVERLRASGLPVCCPEIAPIDDRMDHLDHAYNVSLALRTLGATGPSADIGIVTNTITFDPRCARVWVLTGPNRGGKTTYARSVGLAHVLLGAGLYVPAAAARMSPVDGVFTHFPGRESTIPGKGRLDEEAERVATIFHRATPHSLVLLNEALSGTSTIEALALAHDVLRGLHLLGVRAIYVTHLHELAAHAGEINRTTRGDGTVGSLVAEFDDEKTGHRATFRVRPGSPAGQSQASAIAEQHGISYTQLQALLARRGAAGDANA